MMEFRAYFFGNMYISSIQQGIQAGHSIANMFVKYDPITLRGDILYEWAKNHQTMILLNAGYGSEINDLVEMFSSADNRYPWASFNESQEALNGAITTVGIILPEKIFIGAKQIREGLVSPQDMMAAKTVSWDSPEQKSYKINTWEYEMLLRLNNYGLAK